VLPDSRPRVAMISEHASPLAVLGSTDAGGQNVYVDQVGRNLARLGCRVDVFSRLDDHVQEPVVQMEPGVRAVGIEAGPPSFLPKDDLWPLMPAFLDGIRRFAAQEGCVYDVIHGNFWMSGWVTVQLASQLRIPKVQIFHALGLTKRRHQGHADSSPRDRIAVERSIVRNVDRMIAQCPSERDELIHDYDADIDHITIIPSAVDTSRFRPLDRAGARRSLGLPSEAAIIGYIGRMQPRKDVGNILRATALLRATTTADPMVIVVGGESSEPDPVLTPEIGRLQDLASELGIQHLVHFYGKRQPDDLPLFYAAADVIVSTPWYEPFGLTPLEAMACGRPFIGSHVGGIPFTIRDGETGLLVPPKEPTALSEALRVVLECPESAARMGHLGRRRVEREFTWSTTATRTLNLYMEVIESYERKQIMEIGARAGAGAPPVLLDALPSRGVGIGIPHRDPDTDAA